MRLLENSSTRNIYSSLTEDFWNPCEYFTIIQNFDIDMNKWNNASQEERDAMVRPQLEEFWKQYGKEIIDKGMLETLFDDLEDSNFHTEYRILRDIIEKDAYKINESSIPSMKDENFEETVKRDFRLFLMDKYGDELYKDVNNDDINEYFTGMFYDIWDNDDLDSANEAEKIIRNEYNCLDSREHDDYKEYDDGDTDWNAEEEADSTERMERRYGSIEESAKTLKEGGLIWSNTATEDYYSNLTREEMIKEIKDNGWDEEEINGKPILDADDEELRDYLIPQDIDLDYEDYENSIEPMIEKQIYGDYIVLCGIAANWRGKGEACKAIKIDELKNYLMPNYDAHVKLMCDDQDNLYYTEANHDTPIGGTEMYLYGFLDETAYDNAEKEMQRMYKDDGFDMYYFCDWLGYSDAEELIKSGLLKNIKRDPQYAGILDESIKLEEAKKVKKEDKRVIMQQGNVTCFKENDSTYYVFENESDNEVEYDSQEEAMQDFMERVGINPNDELKEE